MTVGNRADTESIVAAIAMLLALPSEEARKSPSHVSLKVMRPVAMACDSKNSQRLTTLKRTRQVDVTSGTEEMCIATRNGTSRRLLRSESTYCKNPARSAVAGRSGMFYVATTTKSPTRNSSQAHAINPPGSDRKK